jgi:hypothetical protein
MRTEELDAPEPGIYYGLSFDDYKKWRAVNNGSLGPALKSDLHYVYNQTVEREDSSAFRFGRLAHEGRLEPASVLASYAIVPEQLTQGIKVKGAPAKKPKSTTEYASRLENWKATLDEGVEVITTAEHIKLMGVLDALWNEQRSRELFSAKGHAEVSIAWDDPETGLRCKARIDKVTEHLLADLKTTRDASQFEKSIRSYGYDRQAAFYTDGWSLLTGEHRKFWFSAVESDAPHGVICAPVSNRLMLRGRQQYKEALRIVARIKSGKPPLGYDQPTEFDVMPWDIKNDSITHHGAPVKV